MPRGRFVTREEFIELLKRQGTIRAFPSHTQSCPIHIEWSAILDWQYDGTVFSITCTGERAEASEQMPGFNLYEIEERKVEEVNDQS